MVRDLEDVPQQPVFVFVALAGLHDLLDRLVIDVRHEERAGLAAALQEGCLKDDAVLVAIDNLIVVLPPAERAVDEELHPLRPGNREAGDKLSGVGDQMSAGFEGQSVGLQPCLELGRPRKKPDAGTLLEPMTGFLTDDAGAVVEAVFEDRGRRNPQFPNLDAVFGLVLRCVLKPEEIAGPTAMIVVKMRESDDVVVVPLRGAQIGLEFSRQVEASVPAIVGIAHVGVVDEHLLAVGKVEAGAIGVAERMKGQCSGQDCLPGFVLNPSPTAMD
jgi:hypothetical protein